MEKLDIFSLKIPQTGHRCMFAQVENKSKPNVYENMTASTKRTESVCSGSRFKAFFVSLKGPEAEFPIPQTCRPQKQSLLLNNLNKHWRCAGPLCFMREILQHEGKAHRRAALPNSNVLLRFLFFYKL